MFASRGVGPSEDLWL